MFVSFAFLTVFVLGFGDSWVLQTEPSTPSTVVETTPEVQRKAEASNGTTCTEEDVMSFLEREFGEGESEEIDYEIDSGEEMREEDEDDVDWDDWLSNKLRARRMTLLGGQSNAENVLEARRRSKNRNVRRSSTTKKPISKKSHLGHKKIAPIGSCDPFKEGECPASSDNFLCDFKNDYCVDDCDCPGYQKCCVNSCGRRECILSKKASTTKEVVPIGNENKAAEAVFGISTLGPKVYQFPQTVYKAYL